MPGKLMSCVRKVKKKKGKKTHKDKKTGKRKKSSPWAICVAATGQKPHKKKGSKKGKRG